jgi:hypothetical protein
MIIGAEMGHAVALPIYEARDSQMSRWQMASWQMARWEYKGFFHQSTKKQMAEFECPNFFKLDGKWVLLYSPGSQGKYMVGSFDLENLRFQPENEGILDHSYGPRFPNFLTRGLYPTNVLMIAISIPIHTRDAPDGPVVVKDADGRPRDARARPGRSRRQRPEGRTDRFSYHSTLSAQPAVATASISPSPSMSAAIPHAA